MLEGQPGGNVRLVIQVCNDNLAPLPKCVSDRQAYETHERGSIHAKSYLFRFSRIQEGGHALTRLAEDRINFLGLRVSASALGISTEQMIMDSIQHPLRDLRARAIVEEHGSRLTVQSRKLFAHPADRKGGGSFRFGR